MKKKGSQIIAECLLEQGVDTVFGYPGGSVLNIYDALYEYSDRIKHVLTAHEQGASHAADGYARTTGKTGVCIATSGPGSTNLVTGIATAYMDSVPVVAITGNVATPLLGRDSFQEVDITGITMPITKHNFIVKNIEDLAGTIRQAFRIASSGRPGPVLVDVPKDLTAQETDYTFTPAVKDKGICPVPQEKIRDTLKLMAKSERPLIYAGGGILMSDASEKLRTFAERFDCPVCTSIMGLGGFPASHRLCVGLIGMHGTFEAGKATQESDLILVLGARFSDRVAGNRTNFAPGAKIVHVDIDVAEIDKNVETHHHIVGDVGNVLEQLIAKTPQQSHADWLDTIAEWKSVHSIPRENTSEIPNPFDIIKAVKAKMEPGDIVATDVGQHQMWIAQHFPFEKPRTLATSGGLGTMGYGMGAAIGASFGNPEKRVVLFSGDGSFHMNLNELVTLSSYQLPVIVLVMNNGVLGMVRQWQKLFYEGRFSATDPRRKTDLVKLAEAFGVAGLRITKQDEIGPVITQAFAHKGPILIDCQLSPDINVLPMIPPGLSADQVIVKM